MSGIRVKLVAPSALVAAAALMSGCMCCGSEVDVGELVTETRTVELLGATAVEVDLDLGVGKFTVAGGSGPLMTGEFTYNVPEWKPEIEYAVEGGVGRLKVAQPSTKKSVRGNTKNEWTIAFTNDVPIALNIDMGVGNADMELGDLALSRLNVDQGVGNTVIDLSGNWETDLAVLIDGGVGNTKLILPDSVGIRLVSDTGIGKTTVTGLKKEGGVYTNGVYGEAAANFDVKINAGVGNVTIAVSGAKTASI